jgi:hypothetical protein
MYWGLFHSLSPEEELVVTPAPTAAEATDP